MPIEEHMDSTEDNAPALSLLFVTLLVGMLLSYIIHHKIRFIYFTGTTKPPRCQTN